jgi:chromosome segregation ATPase
VTALESTSNELAVLKASMSKLEKDKVSSVTALESTSNELAALKASMSKLEQEKSALQTEVDAVLKKVAANDSSLGKELKEMKKAIAEIKEEKSVLETSYKAACDELATMRETIYKLENEKQELRVNCNRLEAEKSTTSTAVTTNDSPLRSSSDDNTRVHTVVVEDTSALKSKEKNRKSSGADTAKLTAELAALREEYEKALKEVEIRKSIEEQMAGLSSESSEILHALVEEKVKCASVSYELDAAKSKILALTKKADSMKASSEIGEVVPANPSRRASVAKPRSVTTGQMQPPAEKKVDKRQSVFGKLF